MKRWIAKVVYRTNAGPLDVIHDLEELGEIEGLVEAGPDWDTIEVIEIRRSAAASPGYTVERAAVS